VLPLSSAAFAAVLVDVRWPPALPPRSTPPAPPESRVLDADIGRRISLDLARRATHVAFSEPGLAQATGESSPGAGLRRIAVEIPGITGVTLGPEGFLWWDGGREQRMAHPR
jgi:sulfofructose kinase